MGPLSTGPLPPFAFAVESAAFERRWMEELPKRMYALQIQLIPERNILKYAPGTHWTLRLPQLVRQGAGAGESVHTIPL